LVELEDRFPLRGKARTLSIRVRDGEDKDKHLLAIIISHSEKPPDWSGNWLSASRAPGSWS
jgi:hypothetical protein